MTVKETNLRELWRVVKFALISASAGLIQTGSFALLTELTPLSYEPCYLFSLLLSVLWNLTVNRKVTFRSADNYLVALLKVLAYYVVFTPLTTFGGGWLVDTCGWNDYVVQIGSMLFNCITEFLYQRFVVFRKSLDPAQSVQQADDQS